jgi:DNA-binding CsgD family transcriptional regulator/tetratricopeptide (TPR) repeat protein
MDTEGASDWFVGRDEELAVLRGLVSGVIAGVGGAVLVEGEQGIGKTALLRMGVAGAEAECRMVWGAADELGRQFPLGLMSECLGPQGRLAAVGGTAGGVRRGRAGDGSGAVQNTVSFVPAGDPMLAGAERMLALVDRWCAVGPVVLVVEDLQWADEASVMVLQRLCGAVGQLPLLVAGSMRSAPGREDLAGLARRGRVISLSPLSPREVAMLVGRGVGGRPGRQLAAEASRAGGNPLYARELAETLVREGRVRVVDGVAKLVAGEGKAAVPGSLAGVIAGRLGALGEGVLGVLRWAAVLGQEFSAADLQVVTRRDTGQLMRALGQAMEAGVVAAAGPRLGFRHALIRQVLYEGMPASLRAALHLRAARGLDEAGAAVERVAAQLLAAPPEADAWMTDWVAGSAPGLSRGAPQVAAELLERARDRLGWQDPRRERLDADLAMARLMLGDNEQVVRLARPVLDDTRDPALAGRVAWILAYALPRLGQHEQAIEVTDRALARDGLPLVWSARLRARRATSLFALGRYDAARAEAQRAEADGTRAGDRLPVGYALYTLARLDIVGRRTITAGTDVMQRALTVLGDEPQATDLALQIMINLGLILNALAQPGEADRLAARAAALVEHGTPPRQAYVRHFLALHAFHRGRWDDARAELDAADCKQCVCGVGAQVAFHRDDRAAADEYFRGAADIQLPDGEIRLEVEYLLVAWALAAERDADPAEALTRLLAIFDPGATLTFPRLGLISTQWLPDVVRLGLVAGQPAVAAAAAKACAREADTQAAAPWTGGAQHCQGLLDADPGAVGAAAEMLQSAGYPLFSAQALENAAVLYAEKGDTSAARAAYIQAVSLYDRMGADWDIRRAETRLRRHGIRRSRARRSHPPTIGWEALTPTETKIACMIADGQSNPDIAARLSLSRSTVLTHVSHILAKLGAGSRVEIVRQVLLHSPGYEDTVRH